MRYIIKSFFVVFFLCRAFACYSDTEKTGTPIFIENKKQWNKNILFKADIPSGVMFLENTGFTYNFYDGDALSKAIGHNLKASINTRVPDKVKFHGLKVDFIGANKNPVIKKEGKSGGYYNYFLGNDKSVWASEAYAWQKVVYQGLYPYIDLSIYTSDQLKYDFYIKPGGNPKNIQLQYQGADKIYIKESTLYVKTSVNEIIEQKPYAYQVHNGKQIAVPCEFILSENTVSFSFPEGYDKKRELIIDPVLIFSRSSGSTADNFGMTATYDNAGNFYSGGIAFDIGFPTTIGAYDTIFQGPFSQARNTDVVITKYSPDGKSRIYSTYLGGNGTETAHSLIVNEQDELYVFGVTSSPDFPMVNSYDSTFNGGTYKFIANNGTEFILGTDIYIVKFNAAGNALQGSTYIGGSENDGINHSNDSIYTGTTYGYQHPYDSLQFNYGDQFRGEVMLDKEGNCYIVSCTRSPDFPVVNGFQNTMKGPMDGVVCKFNSNLSQLIWSSFIGGSEKDAVYAIKIDTANNVYITGGTCSVDFPTTTGTLFPAYKGGKTDGFIAKINNDGSSILKSTFIGTDKYDQGFFLELDRHGNVYVFGQTLGNYPIIGSVYNNTNSGQFITKLKSNLDSVYYSTVFGNGDGTANISPAAFLIDRCENVYISGWGANILQSTPLTGMPIKDPLTFPPQPTDGFNFYIATFSRDMKEHIFGSYFGGNRSQEHVDGGTSRFDKNGVIYQSVCANCGGNKDFPSSDPSFPLNMASNCNNGVFKIDFEITPKINFEPSAYFGCAPLTVTFQNYSRNITSYFWDFGNGDTTSTQFQPVRTFVNAGTYPVTLIVTDSICDIKDTITKMVYVSPLNSGFVTVSSDKDSILKTESAQITTTPPQGYTYSWQPAESLSDPLIPNPVASPDVTTTYVLTINDNDACVYSDSVTIYLFEINCKEPEIFIPNAFTPNGDGENDKLFVRGKHITEMHFTVYNRWGENVFETTDQNVGWDGYYKGMKADPGVFVYHLTAKCRGGQDFFKKGNVTLIR